MKTSKFLPLSNNVLVRKTKPIAGEEKVDALYMPAGVDTSVTEIVTIVAISEELHLPDNGNPFASVGDRCLIHKHLNAVEVDVKNEKLWLISYANLLGVVK